MRPGVLWRGEIVAHPYGNVFACLCVLHVIDRNLIHIFRSVRHLYHFDAPKTFAGVEKSFEHVFEREVRSYFCFVQVEFLFLHLSLIVVIVPRSDFEAAAVGIYVCLHVGHFLTAAADSRLKHL